MISNLLRRTFALKCSPITFYNHFTFTEQHSGESTKHIEITKENAQLIIDKWVK